MTNPEIEVANIAFGDEGIALQYIDAATDIRVDGRLVLAHQLQLHAGHPDYADAIERLQALAVAVVRSALEDYAESVPYHPDVEEDPDDEGGMGE